MATFPSSYANVYFYADYCGNWIRTLDLTTNATAPFASGLSSPVDLKVSQDGDLYYLDRGSSSVRRVTYGQARPAIVTQPASRTVAAGATVTFSVAASGTGPLTYQWERNGSPIAGAISSSLVVGPVTAADSGATFRVVVSNAFGSTTSQAAILTVTSNQAPSVTITSPATGTLYAGGQTISYAGTAVDPEDGTLPASTFTWTIVFHHDTHTHPFLGPIGGVASGSFTIPRTGETSANVWYRITLSVRDSAGATTTVVRDVLPRKVRLTLASSPTGRQLTLDGQPLTAPFAFDSVVGVTRAIGAPTPQTASPLLDFTGWSDGRAPTHDITTPSSGKVFTATFASRQTGGTGDGLTAQYYDDASLKTLVGTRIDPVVDFNWGTGTPLPSMAPDQWTVRWSGWIQPASTEVHTFHVQSDDGVRLWVNGVLLADTWTAGGYREVQGSIALTAGQGVTVRIEYREKYTTALMRLLWSTPTRPKALVPGTRLYTTTPP